MYNGHNPILNRLMFLLLPMLMLSCKSSDELNKNNTLINLSHVYVTLDSTGYSSIMNSDFLKENFAHTVTKTIRADSTETWTGTYIFGRNTYIEVYNSGREKNTGLSGIAFGADQPGGIDSIYQRIKNTGLNHFEKTERLLKKESGEIPWFFSLKSTKKDSTGILSTWVMEYELSYMKQKFPDMAQDSINITRELYNHKSYNKNLLMKDIIEVELALNEFDYNKLLEELKIFGYKTEQEGYLVTGYGPDIKFIFRPAVENKAGIYRLKFSLTDREYKQQRLQFGNKSRLILNKDKTADWYFEI